MRIIDLEELEARFQHAFATGDPSGLEVIGYGEISSVVAWQGTAGRVAAKRLPNYPNTASRRAHRQLMQEYIDILETNGIVVLPTSFEELGDDVLYTVQPLVEQELLAVEVLRRADDREGEALLETVIAGTAAVAGDPLLGLDVQLSNWVVVDGAVRYFDISTPFIRDPATHLSLLDTSLYVASLPWLLRMPVQRFLAEAIVAEYFDLRTTVINAIANMKREHLETWIPRAVEVANRHVSETITVEDVMRYYRKDQGMWALLQRMRRLDRWWQLRVRRRAYPVLLPGPIAR